MKHSHFSVVPLCMILLWGQLEAPLSAQSNDAQVTKSGLNKLRGQFQSKQLAGPMPWKVVTEWVQRYSHSEEILGFAAFANGSLLNNIQKRADFYADLEKDLERVRLDVLTADAPVSVGINSILFSDGTRFTDETHRIVDKQVPLRTPSSAELTKATSALRSKATATLLGDAASKESIKAARDAATALRGELIKGVGEGNSSKVQSAIGAISSVLNEDAKAKLLSLKPSEYNKIVDIGTALAVTPAKVIGQNLSADRAMDLLAAFGQLDQAQEQFSKNFLEQSNTAQDALANDLEEAIKQWPKVIQDYRASVPQVFEVGKALPKEVGRVATFVSDFAQIRGMLAGGIDGLGDPAAVAMLNMSLTRTGLMSDKLASSLGAVLTTKSNYVGAAIGLASAIGIQPPKELETILPLAMTAVSFLSGAGPLAVLGGLGGGAGPLSVLGGLGGGGSKDHSADFAKIQQQLAAINQRLAAIEGKLDELGNAIAKNHNEVMSALEALNYDVYRTHQLLLWDIHNDVLGPCVLAAERNGEGDALQLVKQCDERSDLLMARAKTQTPAPLTFRSNFQYRAGEPSALKVEADETRARSFLASVMAKRDCIGLFHPSANLGDLQRKVTGIPVKERVRDLQKSVEPPSTSVAPSEAVSCSGVVGRRPDLIEPGILRHYIDTELSALLSTGATQPALTWWNERGTIVKSRWLKEIELLDDAIAQQAITNGDVILGELAKLAETAKEGAKLAVLSAEEKAKFSKDTTEKLRQYLSLKEVWGREDRAGLLAENIARYWIWDKLREKEAPRTLYSLAWYSKDPRFWMTFLKADSATQTFSTETVESISATGSKTSEMRWFITFVGLPKVPLPSPAEWSQFELRWSNALTDLVAIRRRLSDELSGMEYLSRLRRAKGQTGDWRLLEALAVAASRSK